MAKGTNRIVEKADTKDVQFPNDRLKEMDCRIDSLVVLAAYQNSVDRAANFVGGRVHKLSCKAGRRVVRVSTWR
jgi:hypothetical protein